MKVLLFFLLLQVILFGSENIIDYQKRFDISIDDAYELSAVARVKSSIEVFYTNKETKEEITINSMGVYSNKRIQKEKFFSCINGKDKCSKEFSTSFYFIKKNIDHIKNGELEVYIFQGVNNTFLAYIFIKNKLEGSLLYESKSDQKVAILNMKKILKTIQIKQYQHVELENLLNEFKSFQNNKKYDKANDILIQALIMYQDSNEVKNIAKDYFKTMYNRKLIKAEFYEYL